MALYFGAGVREWTENAGDLGVGGGWKCWKERG